MPNSIKKMKLLEKLLIDVNSVSKERNEVLLDLEAAKINFIKEYKNPKATMEAYTNYLESELQKFYKS